MEEFLQRTKSILISGDDLPRVHAILGNRVCGLDSTVSALAYAYFLYKTRPNDDLYVPVLNIDRSEFPLRNEVLFVMQQLNITDTCLIFRDEIDLHLLNREGKLCVTLVDHNMLASPDNELETAVIKIINHNEQERVQSLHCEVVQEPVGSCITLIVSEILQHAPELLNKQLAHLFRGTILLDCANMTPETRKVTSKDEEIVAALEARFPDLPLQKEMFEALQQAKFDVTGLSTEQILLKDFKELSEGETKLAISTVYTTLENFLFRPNFINDLKMFAGRYCYDIHVLMTISLNEGGEPSRQVAIFTDNDDLSNRVCCTLEECQNPCLQLEPIEHGFQEIRAYQQGSSSVSQKQIVPLIKDCIHRQQQGLSMHRRTSSTEAVNGSAPVSEGSSGVLDLSGPDVDSQNTEYMGESLLDNSQVLNASLQAHGDVNIDLMSPDSGLATIRSNRSSKESSVFLSDDSPIREAVGPSSSLLQGYDMFSSLPEGETVEDEVAPIDNANRFDLFGLNLVHSNSIKTDSLQDNKNVLMTDEIPKAELAPQKDNDVQAVSLNDHISMELTEEATKITDLDNQTYKLDRIGDEPVKEHVISQISYTTNEIGMVIGDKKVPPTPMNSFVEGSPLDAGPPNLFAEDVIEKMNEVGNVSSDEADSKYLGQKNEFENESTKTMSEENDGWTADQDELSNPITQDSNLWIRFDQGSSQTNFKDYDRWSEFDLQPKESTERSISDIWNSIEQISTQALIDEPTMSGELDKIPSVSHDLWNISGKETVLSKFHKFDEHYKFQNKIMSVSESSDVADEQEKGNEQQYETTFNVGNLSESKEYSDHSYLWDEPAKGSMQPIKVLQEVSDSADQRIQSSDRENPIWTEPIFETNLHSYNLSAPKQEGYLNSDILSEPKNDEDRPVAENADEWAKFDQETYSSVSDSDDSLSDKANQKTVCTYNVCGSRQEKNTGFGNVNFWNESTQADSQLTAQGLEMCNTCQHDSSNSPSDHAEKWITHADLVVEVRNDFEWDITQPAFQMQTTDVQQEHDHSQTIFEAVDSADAQQCRPTSPHLSDTRNEFEEYRYTSSESLNAWDGPVKTFSDQSMEFPVELSNSEQEAKYSETQNFDVWNEEQVYRQVPAWKQEQWNMFEEASGQSTFESQTWYNQLQEISQTDADHLEMYHPSDIGKQFEHDKSQKEEKDLTQNDKEPTLDLYDIHCEAKECNQLSSQHDSRHHESDDYVRPIEHPDELLQKGLNNADMWSDSESKFIQPPDDVLISNKFEHELIQPNMPNPDRQMRGESNQSFTENYSVWTESWQEVPQLLSTTSDDCKESKRELIEPDVHVPDVITDYHQGTHQTFSAIPNSWNKSNQTFITSVAENTSLLNDSYSVSNSPGIWREAEKRGSKSAASWTDVKENSKETMTNRPDLTNVSERRFNLSFSAGADAWTESEHPFLYPDAESLDANNDSKHQIAHSTIVSADPGHIHVQQVPAHPGQNFTLTADTTIDKDEDLSELYSSVKFESMQTDTWQTFETPVPCIHLQQGVTDLFEKSPISHNNCEEGFTHSDLEDYEFRVHRAHEVNQPALEYLDPWNPVEVVTAETISVESKSPYVEDITTMDTKQVQCSGCDNMSYIVRTDEVEAANLEDTDSVSSNNQTANMYSQTLGANITQFSKFSSPDEYFTSAAPACIVASQSTVSQGSKEMEYFSVSHKDQLPIEPLKEFSSVQIGDNPWCGTISFAETTTHKCFPTHIMPGTPDERMLVTSADVQSSPELFTSKAELTYENVEPVSSYTASDYFYEIDGLKAWPKAREDNNLFLPADDAAGLHNVNASNQRSIETEHMEHKPNTNSWVSFGNLDNCISINVMSSSLPPSAQKSDFWEAFSAQGCNLTHDVDHSPYKFIETFSSHSNCRTKTDGQDEDGETVVNTANAELHDTQSDTNLVERLKQSNFLLTDISSLTSAISSTEVGSSSLEVEYVDKSDSNLASNIFEPRSNQDKKVTSDEGERTGEIDYIVVAGREKMSGVDTDGQEKENVVIEDINARILNIDYEGQTFSISPAITVQPEFSDKNSSALESTSTESLPENKIVDDPFMRTSSQGEGKPHLDENASIEDELNGQINIEEIDKKDSIEDEFNTLNEQKNIQDEINEKAGIEDEINMQDNMQEKIDNKASIDNEFNKQGNIQEEINEKAGINEEFIEKINIRVKIDVEASIRDELIEQGKSQEEIDDEGSIEDEFNIEDTIDENSSIEDELNEQANIQEKINDKITIKDEFNKQGNFQEEIDDKASMDNEFIKQSKIQENINGKANMKDEFNEEINIENKIDENTSMDELNEQDKIQEEIDDEDSIEDEFNIKDTIDENSSIEDELNEQANIQEKINDKTIIKDEFNKQERFQEKIDDKASTDNEFNKQSKIQENINGKANMKDEFNEEINIENKIYENTSMDELNEQDKIQEEIDDEDSIEDEFNIKDTIDENSSIEDEFNEQANIQEEINEKAGINEEFIEKINIRVKIDVEASIRDELIEQGKSQEEIDDEDSIEDEFNIEDTIDENSSIEDELNEQANIQEKINDKTNIKDEFNKQESFQEKIDDKASIDNEFHKQSKIQENINGKANMKDEFNEEINIENKIDENTSMDELNEQDKIQEEIDDEDSIEDEFNIEDTIDENSSIEDELNEQANIQEKINDETIIKDEFNKQESFQEKIDDKASIDNEFHKQSKIQENINGKANMKDEFNEEINIENKIDENPSMDELNEQDKIQEEIDDEDSIEDEFNIKDTIDENSSIEDELNEQANIQEKINDKTIIKDEFNKQESFQEKIDDKASIDNEFNKQSKIQENINGKANMKDEFNEEINIDNTIDENATLDEFNEQDKIQEEIDDEDSIADEFNIEDTIDENSSIEDELNEQANIQEKINDKTIIKDEFNKQESFQEKIDDKASIDNEFHKQSKIQENINGKAKKKDEFNEEINIENKIDENTSMDELNEQDKIQEEIDDEDSIEDEFNIKDTIDENSSIEDELNEQANIQEKINDKTIIKDEFNKQESFQEKIDDKASIDNEFNKQSKIQENINGKANMKDEFNEEINIDNTIDENATLDEFNEQDKIQEEIDDEDSIEDEFNIKDTIDENSSIEDELNEQANIQEKINDKTIIKDEFNKQESFQEKIDDKASIDNEFHKQSKIQENINGKANMKDEFNEEINIENTIDENVTLDEFNEQDKIQEEIDDEDSIEDELNIEDTIDENSSLEDELNEQASIQEKINGKTIIKDEFNKQGKIQLDIDEKNIMEDKFNEEVNIQNEVSEKVEKTISEEELNEQLNIQEEIYQKTRIDDEFNEKTYETASPEDEFSEEMNIQEEDDRASIEDEFNEQGNIQEKIDKKGNLEDEFNEETNIQNKLVVEASMKDEFNKQSNIQEEIDEDEFNKEFNIEDTINENASIEDIFTDQGKIREEIAEKASIGNDFEKQVNIQDKISKAVSIEDKFNDQVNIQDDIAKKTYIVDEFIEGIDFQDEINKKASIGKTFNEQGNIQEEMNEKASVKDEFNEEINIQEKIKETTNIKREFSEQGKIQEEINKESSIEDEFNEEINIEDTIDENASIENKFNEQDKTQEEIDENSSIEDEFNEQGNIQENNDENASVKDEFREQGKIQEKIDEKANLQDELNEEINIQDKIHTEASIKYEFNEQDNIQEDINEKARSGDKFNDKINIENKMIEKASIEDKLNDQVNIWEEIDEKTSTEEEFNQKIDIQEKIDEETSIKDKLNEDGSIQEEIKDEFSIEDEFSEEINIQAEIAAKASIEDQFNEQGNIQDETCMKNECNEEIDEKADFKDNFDEKAYSEDGSDGNSNSKDELVERASIEEGDTESWTVLKANEPIDISSEYSITETDESESEHSVKELEAISSLAYENAAATETEETKDDQNMIHDVSLEMESMMWSNEMVSIDGSERIMPELPLTETHLSPNTVEGEKILNLSLPGPTDTCVSTELDKINSTELRLSAEDVRLGMLNVLNVQEQASLGSTASTQDSLHSVHKEIKDSQIEEHTRSKTEDVGMDIPFDEGMLSPLAEESRPAPPNSLNLNGIQAGRKKLVAPEINLSLDQSEGSILSDDNLDTPDDLDINVDDLETPDEADSLEYSGHGNELEWEDETPIATNTAKEDVEPIPEYTAEQERTDNRLWRTVVIGEQEHRIDMKAIEPYQKVISHGGYYSDGLNAIIVFAACFLPESTGDNYHYVMENLFLYVISTLELLVAEDYLIVYLNGATPRRRMPGFSWMKRCYQMIDRRLRKNLKSFIIVHPSWFIRAILAVTRPFISTKFNNKIRYVSSLTELEELIPMQHVQIPESIRKLDEELRESSDTAKVGSLQNDAEGPSIQQEMQTTPNEGTE